MIDFADWSLPANAIVFALACVLVWQAGSRLSGYADAFSRKTGLGQAVVGIILLAAVTSLPEIAATATASLAGNAALAVNNLFGSIASQVALLAIVDFMIGREALTSVIPEPSVLLEGSLNVILLSFAAVAIVAGDVPLFGAGAFSWSCILLYFVAVYILSKAEGKHPWLAAHKGQVEHFKQPAEQKDHADRPMRSLMGRIAVAALIILVAGFVLARSGEALAEQTGLGASFVGFVLVAFATSLPELSAAIGAATRGLYTMAISDILGTNLINIALIGVSDLLDPGTPILNRLGSFSIAGALLAVIVTAILQAGLAERRDKSVLRMGYDSILILMTYGLGLVLLFTLRPDR